MDTREAFNWTHALDEAKVIVRGSPLFKKFISGTPLENDIPVWIVEFASKLWVWKELETAIADSWVMQGKIKSLEADLQAALNQPQPTADVVERVLVQKEGRVFWIYKDGSHRCVTDADCTAINAALPQQPSLPQGMTEENVRLFNDAMTLITKSLAGMLTDNSFASPYPEDHRPTTPRWVIAKFAHDCNLRVAYVNDIKQCLNWIRNATESVRIRALSALPRNSVKGVE